MGAIVGATSKQSQGFKLMLRIQVIQWLIEQEVVGCLRQNLRHRESTPLAARQAGNIPVFQS